MVVITSLIFCSHPVFQQSDSTEEDTGHDATRLKYLFSELTTLKEDSQQRSWALHEDQKTIQGHLDELLSILVSV